MVTRRPAPLIVWTNGQKVGEWTARDGDHRFQYADEWIASSSCSRVTTPNR